MFGYVLQEWIIQSDRGLSNFHQFPVAKYRAFFDGTWAAWYLVHYDAVKVSPRRKVPGFEETEGFTALWVNLSTTWHKAF